MNYNLKGFTNQFDEEYLSIVSDILLSGDLKLSARDSLPGTVSLFGKASFNVDVSEYFPLLASKSVYWNGVSSELLWFLLGDTDLRPLLKLKNNIWVGDAFRSFSNRTSLEELLSREELDTIIADSLAESNSNMAVLKRLEELFSEKVLSDETFGDLYSDLGTVYGFNLRYFGGKYLSSKFKPDGGTDQLLSVINLMKNSPSSRRIQFTYLNPSNVKDAVLPPCHLYYHFNIVKNNEDAFIDVSMTQRSADFFLGVPFNIASTALLLYMFSNNFKFKPRNLTINFDDAHVYLGLGWDEKDYSKFRQLQKNYSVTDNVEGKILSAYSFLDEMTFYLESKGRDPGHLLPFKKQLEQYFSLIKDNSIVYPSLSFDKSFDFEAAVALNNSFRVSGLENNVSHIRNVLSQINLEKPKGYNPKRIIAPLYAGFSPNFSNEEEINRLYKSK